MNSDVHIGWATSAHLAWLCEHDSHVDGALLEKKVAGQQILVAEMGNYPVAYLRFGLFWDEIPFMNMLFVKDTHRGQGLGKALVQFWENEMRKANYARVMTSTQENEAAQHFYRKLGYQDMGSFALPGDPVELVLVNYL